MLETLISLLMLGIMGATNAIDVLPDADTYLQAHRDERAGNHAEALRAYTVCIKPEGPLRQYAALAVARCRYAMGDVAGAAAAYRTCIAEGGDGPWRLQAQAALAMLPPAENPVDNTLALLEEIVAVAPEPWWMQPYAWRAAEHRLESPETASLGYAYFRDAVATNPYRKLRLEAARTLRASPSMNDQAAAVMGFARNEEFPDAGAALAAMVMKTMQEKDASADLSQLLAYLLGKEEDDAPESATPASLGSNIAQLVLTYRVYQSARQEHWATACDAAQRLAERYAEHEEVADVLWWLGRNLQGNDQGDAAEETFRLLHRTFPKHSRTDDALYRVGQLQWWRGDKKEATETLLALTEAYPESEDVAHAYFLIAEFESTRDTEKAESYRARAAASGLGRYYAHRATAELVANMRSGAAHFVLALFRAADSAGLGFMHEVALKSTPDTPLLSDDLRLARLRFFGAHGLAEGQWEALALCRTLAGNPERATYLEAIAQAGFAHMAVQWKDHLPHNGDDDARATRTALLYPRVHWSMVKEIAAEARIDPYLILAIAKQESTFRARIKSTVGAVGVMQLLPSTARWMADITPALTLQEADDLHSARNSIRIGAFYLRRLLNNTKNDNLVEALAAYNGGPGNASKWRKRFPQLGVDEFIEAIPFEETRNYVKRVLGNYAAYHSLY